VPPWPHHGVLCLQIGGQLTTSVFVWSFFSNNIPWQYIAIRIVIQLSCIAIYRNTLLLYRDTPTTETSVCSLICKLSIRIMVACWFYFDMIFETCYELYGCHYNYTPLNFSPVEFLTIIKFKLYQCIWYHYNPWLQITYLCLSHNVNLPKMVT
jgi:hypothetical protein